MNTAMKHLANKLTHFAGKLFLLETALLIIIALVWRLTDWHTTDNFGAALSTAGGIIIGIGLFILVTKGSSNDTKLIEAEMEMRSWDHKGQRRFISPYSDSIHMWTWLISLGMITVGMGIVFNIFVP